KSWRCVSRSTIFPLASSPHCRPTTQVQAMDSSRVSGGVVSSEWWMVEPAQHHALLTIHHSPAKKNARATETASGTKSDLWSQSQCSRRGGRASRSNLGRASPRGMPREVTSHDVLATCAEPMTRDDDSRRRATLHVDVLQPQ